MLLLFQAYGRNGWWITGALTNALRIFVSAGVLLHGAVATEATEAEQAALPEPVPRRTRGLSRPRGLSDGAGLPPASLLHRLQATDARQPRAGLRRTPLVARAGREHVAMSARGLECGMSVPWVQRGLECSWP